VQRVRDAVQAIWPAASVQVFGSYATGARKGAVRAACAAAARVSPCPPGLLLSWKGHLLPMNALWPLTVGCQLSCLTVI
jgi:hypothetical protein